MRRALTLSFVSLFICSPFFALAQSADELQSEINDHNAQITQLNKEIAQYQEQLNSTTKQKNTLQNKINQLDLQRKKLTASIRVTQNQIASTQLQIQQLDTGIESKTSSIENNEAGLGESLRRLSQAEQRPLALAVLASETVTDAWQDVDSHQALQEAVQTDIEILSREKQSLTVTKVSVESKKKELEGQKKTLLTQEGSLNATRKAQSELLSETKSQESNYQSILAKKKAQQASFEAALQDLQTKLQYTIRPDQITAAGKGVLRQPLDNVRITQYFGNTPFASSGAYGGKGHNGIDFAAPLGTPVKAALSGTVVGTGNTDAVRGCYSFGKWVMVKHANGLNTMYAHFSQVSVVTGQSVSTGSVLGYSGESGYATGPHLHFGVYVSSATQIIKLGSATKSATPCSNAVMPVVPITGYLNPMNYF